MIVCDFCSSPDVTREYPARDFAIGGLGPAGGVVPLCASGGSWAACEGCGKLIDADDRGALAERAITLIGFPAEPSFIEAMREIHNAFFIARAGPAVPVAPKGDA